MYNNGLTWRVCILRNIELQLLDYTSTCVYLTAIGMVLSSVYDLVITKLKIVLNDIGILYITIIYV